MNVGYAELLKTIVSTIIGTYVPVTTGGDIGTIDFAYVTACILFIIIINFILKCFYSVIFRKI